MVYHVLLSPNLKYVRHDAFATALTKMGSQAVRNGERRQIDLLEDAAIASRTDAASGIADVRETLAS